MLALLLPLVAATLVAQGPASPASDRAFNLAGTWTCSEPDQTTTGRALFTTRPNGLSMQYVDVSNGQSREIDADFSYDSHAQTWRLDESAPDLLRFRGFAGAWTGQTWEFDGAVFPPDPGSSLYNRLEPAHVTFVAFGNDEFEMIRTQETGGQLVLHDPFTDAVMDDSCTRSRG